MCLWFAETLTLNIVIRPLASEISPATALKNKNKINVSCKTITPNVHKNDIYEYSVMEEQLSKTLGSLKLLWMSY